MPRYGYGMSLNSTGLGLEVAPNSVYSGTNYILNSFFDEDNSYVTEASNTFQTSNYWRFLSPIFTNTVDYKSYSQVYFLKTQFPYADTGIGATIQKRIIKFSGTGSALIPFNNYGLVAPTYPSGFIRMYPDFPMRSITLNSSLDGWSGSYNGNNQPQTPANNDWVKYERYQLIQVPDGLFTANIGCMVQVPQGDDLRSLNFGGIYGYTYSGGKTTANCIAITGSGVSSLLTGSFSNGQDSLPPPYNARFQWNGAGRWNDLCDVVSIDQSKSTGYRGWRQINKTITLPAGTSRIFGFALYFAENHSYLNNDGIQSGGIWFYNPYVTFS